MPSRLFVIGASTSGLQALCALVQSLPADFPAPIFIVQHTSPAGRSRLPEILSRAGPLPACHPGAGEFIRPGRIYVAPPDHHMLIRPRYVWLSRGPRENHTRPAVDPLFRSAALAYGPAVVGVVLTGYLDDGTAGLTAVKACGGSAIVQDPSEATAPSMPTSALKHVPGVDHCCRIQDMAALLVRFAADDAPTVRPFEARALLEIEDRIAAGSFSPADWQMLSSQGKFSGLTCPECQSPLCELPAQRMLRFRCLAGHAFSAQSLASARAEARENSTAALYAALMEELALSERILADPIYREEAVFADELGRRVGGLTLQAHQIQKWSTATPEGSGSSCSKGRRTQSAGVDMQPNASPRISHWYRHLDKPNEDLMADSSAARDLALNAHTIEGDLP